MKIRDLGSHSNDGNVMSLTTIQMNGNSLFTAFKISIQDYDIRHFIFPFVGSKSNLFYEVCLLVKLNYTHSNNSNLSISNGGRMVQISIFTIAVTLLLGHANSVSI